MANRSSARATLAATLMLSAACGLQETEIPRFTGPSELGLSVAVAATPDTLSRDGVSQSTILVTARGPNGSPAASVALRLDMAINGVLQDFGTLSARTIQTGADGRGSAVYTAPQAPPPGAATTVTVLTIVVTSIGSDAQGAVRHQATIRLVPLGVILPPPQSATARFTFSPSAPAASQLVQFDGSNSCAGQADSGSSGPCPGDSGVIVNYHWDFGDGGTAEGPLVSHSFAKAQTYSVTLTVTTDRGGSGSTTKPVPVAAGLAPTADFVFSPTTPAVGQSIQFDASASRAAPGRTIVQYLWNWGDGESGNRTSPTEDHDYLTAGTYNVVLTVVDDAGQRGTVTKPVAVGSGNPTALFTFIVTNPATHTIQVDGSGSMTVGSATITNYSWSWGDTSSNSGSSSVQTHSYGGANTYTVRLTVTDSLGRSGSFSTGITVP